jgi:hypothetical protein
VDDSLVLVPDAFPDLVKCPTIGTLEPPFTRVKTRNLRVESCAAEEERVGFDSSVDGPLITIDMDLGVSLGTREFMRAGNVRDSGNDWRRLSRRVPSCKSQYCPGRERVDR